VLFGARSKIDAGRFSHSPAPTVQTLYLCPRCGQRWQISQTSIAPGFLFVLMLYPRTPRLRATIENSLKVISRMV
jgi:hypothetical protein